jgi:hypothetical protein
MYWRGGHTCAADNTCTDDVKWTGRAGQKDARSCSEAGNGVSGERSGSGGEFEGNLLIARMCYVHVLCVGIRVRYIVERAGRQYSDEQMFYTPPPAPLTCDWDQT